MHTTSLSTNVEGNLYLVVNIVVIDKVIGLKIYTYYAS